MVNRGLRPLFENPRLSRCAHSNSSVRRANINFFTLIFFTCVKDFAQEEGRNVVKLLLYLEDYWQTFAAHNDNSKLLELLTPSALRRNPRPRILIEVRDCKTPHKRLLDFEIGWKFFEIGHFFKESFSAIPNMGQIIGYWARLIRKQRAWLLQICKVYAPQMLDSHQTFGFHKR